MNKGQKSKAYSTNLIPTNTRDGADNFQTTEYCNFDFNGIVKLDGKYYAFNQDGMYELGGCVDDNCEISWNFKTHIDTFGRNNVKTPRYAYVTGRYSAETQVVLQIGEDDYAQYNYHTVDLNAAGVGRVVFGRGNKATYYAIGMSGTGPAQIDTIKLDIDVLSREIK